jgi:hypothetical protein
VANGMINEKLYILNLALILIGQFMWAEQIKSYNGNTIARSNEILPILGWEGVGNRQLLCFFKA